MARQETSALAYVNKGLNEIVQLYSTKQRLWYTGFTNPDSADTERIRVGTEGNFPSAPVMGANEAMAEVDFQTPYMMDVTAVKYAQQFKYDREMKLSDVYGLLKKVGPKLVRSAYVSLEQQAARPFTLATSTSFATADGVAFASASHLSNVGLQSNLLTPGALTYTTLELAIQQLRQQLDHEGNPQMFAGKANLLCHQAGEMNAMRVTQAEKLPSVNWNDPNVAGGFVANVIASPFFSSAPTLAFALVATGMDNPIKMWIKRPVTSYSWDINGNDQSASSVVTSGKCYAADWRNFTYNNGS